MQRRLRPFLIAARELMQARRSRIVVIPVQSTLIEPAAIALARNRAAPRVARSAGHRPARYGKYRGCRW